MILEILLDSHHVGQLCKKCVKNSSVNSVVDTCGFTLSNRTV